MTLLIRQNTEQGDTYDEIALKEYSMDALKAVISGNSNEVHYLTVLLELPCLPQFARVWLLNILFYYISA